MSILILGGHECMEKEYKSMIKKKGYKTKIYTTMPSGLKKRIGNPDAIILFMSTISHSMAEMALKDAKKKNVPVIKVQNSSKVAFINCLEDIEACTKNCNRCIYKRNVQ